LSWAEKREKIEEGFHGLSGPEAFVQGLAISVITVCCVANSALSRNQPRADGLGSIDPDRLACGLQIKAIVEAPTFTVVGHRTPQAAPIRRDISCRTHPAQCSHTPGEQHATPPSLP
jgi:hypothetical protein